MTFFWQNPEFRLTATPSPQRPQDQIAGLTALGLVVNPRLYEPLLVVTDGTNVGIRSLRERLRRVGTGYYGEEDDAAAVATDLPRSHTPRGVDPKGRGYGTSLYTALCLGAYHQDMGWTEIETGIDGQGISSEESSRSTEADSWWDAATKRGLTLSSEEVTEETEENVDIDVDADDIEGCVSVDGTVSYVNRLNVDITREETQHLNSYGFDSAESHNLVVSAFSVEIPEWAISPEQALRYVWEGKQEESEDDEFDSVALLALDVRGLSEEAINLLSVIFVRAGLDNEAIDNMRWRWRYNADPGSVSSQMRLLNPADPVIAARKATGWAELSSLP